MDDTCAPLVQFETVEALDPPFQGVAPETAQQLTEATSFLRSFSWVNGIEQTYLGNSFEGILGIFLFKISPNRADVDDFVWVIVGDLPSAYITVDDSPNPAAALDGYIGAMEDWGDAVVKGEPTDGLIPVDAPATQENAMALKSRLQFLDDNILPRCNGDLDVDLRP